MQKAGTLFLAPEFWTYNTSHYWNRSGERLYSGGEFDKKEANLYAEYGLDDNNTLVGKALYDWIDETNKGKTVGFEDFEVAWRRLLCKGKETVMSTQMWLVIPSGKSNKQALRYGRFAYEWDFLYGQSFKFFENYGFLDCGLGYRWYFGYPSDQVRAHINLGVDYTKKWQFITSLYLEYGVYNGRRQVIQELIVNDPNYRLLKGFFTLRYRLSGKVSMVAGVYSHIWGRNVGTGGGFRGGFWIDF